MRRVFATGIIILMGALPCLAQEKYGTIRGSLLDSLDHHPLSLATITIFRAKDTSIVTYRLSDLDGNFKVPGLPVDVPLRMMITFSGYKVTRKVFQLQPSATDIDFKVFALPRDTLSLDEVVVTAERPPVIIRKDTIEFNASAFKTLPSALVEDLLKKLPGVEVTREGDILVNGKPVNRILVEGKEFFGTDVRVATRNLPANVIDKVQVTDDLEEWYANRRVPRSEVGKIINLKLKKGVKKGWFGKVYAGTGTEGKYEAGAILNLFRDTFQVSVLGYTNDINRSAFTSKDAITIGGFQRSSFQNLNYGADGSSYNIDGLSFGGSSQGKESSLGTGINLNHELGKKTTLNFQYFFGKVNNELNSLSKSQQFIDDTTLFTQVSRLQENESFMHRIGGSIKKKFSQTAELVYRPLFTIQSAPSYSDGITNSSSNFRCYFGFS